MPVGEFVSLLFLLICRPTNRVFAEKIFVIQLFFKDFVSIFLNFLGLLVYLGHTPLNGCFQDVANAKAKKVVLKFVLRKATYFCLFLFFREIFFAPHFLFIFDFVKLGIAPLILKIIINILLLSLFNFKTQNSLYILIDDSITDFLKRFIRTFHVFCYIPVTDFLKRFICTFHVFCNIILIVLIALRQK